MQNNRLTYVIIGLLSSTFYFASKELIGNGLGWIGIAIGILLSTVLIKRFASTSQRTQLLSTIVIAVICGIVLLGSVWYNKRNTTKDLLTIRGSWEAMDSEDKYVMEVDHDSTYLTASSMPNRVSYTMLLSQDSLVLKNSPDNILALRLDKLTEEVLEVGMGDSKLIFHKRK
jgi:amino acid transporter